MSSPEPTDQPSEGLYESLLTRRLRSRLNAHPLLVPDIEYIDAADQPVVLARHVQDAVQRVLASERSPQRRVELVNRILADLGVVNDQSEGEPRQLRALTRPPRPGEPVVSTHRPRTPLSDAALLTNAHGEPSLGAELSLDPPRE